MDPNETLRMLRLTIKQLRVDEDSGVAEAHANEICEYFEALDGWLSMGGFPPEVWREGPDAVGAETGPDAPRDRYAQCTDDCTTDCGACKGAGRPVAGAGNG